MFVWTISHGVLEHEVRQKQKHLHNNNKHTLACSYLPLTSAEQVDPDAKKRVIQKKQRNPDERRTRSDRTRKTGAVREEVKTSEGAEDVGERCAAAAGEASRSWTNQRARQAGRRAERFAQISSSLEIECTCWLQCASSQQPPPAAVLARVLQENIARAASPAPTASQFDATQRRSESSQQMHEICCCCAMQDYSKQCVTSCPQIVLYNVLI